MESLAKATAPGKTNDGDVLYFQVSKSGASSWIFRYKLDGRSREMGLGPFPTVPLIQARQLAADHSKVLNTGTDPLPLVMPREKRNARLSVRLMRAALRSKI